MASPKQAAKGGKKTKARKPAPRVVAAPASIVRRASNVMPKAAKPPKTPPAPAQAADQRPDDGRAHTREARQALSGYSRDNPDHLGGEALRQFANERGMALSEVNTMTDAKVREQLRYLTSTAYDEA